MNRLLPARLAAVVATACGAPRGPVAGAGPDAGEATDAAAGSEIARDETPQGATPDVSGEATDATGQPAISVVPSPIEFGWTPPGGQRRIDVEMRSVGTATLTVSDIRLRDGPGDSATFALDLTPAGGLPQLTLPAGATATVGVTHAPVESPAGPDRNALVLTSNAPPGTLVVEVVVVEAGDCPLPVISIDEGEEVPPQTVLHLHGEESVPSAGTIVKYDWSVTQPPENAFVLVPSDDFQALTHEVNVAGTYTYCLDVCDEVRCSSDPGCHTSACKTVTVCACTGLHCELTWSTPGDPDPYDEGPGKGTDLDIHLAREEAWAEGPDVDGDGEPDPWFDLAWDTFWFPSGPGATPGPGVAGMPRLDRDDTDGAGPENVNLENPPWDKEYRLGVHYWDDHSFGPAFPHVRCYIFGQLVLDRDLLAMNRPLLECDLWEVARLYWPSGKVEAVTNPDGSLKITPAYVNPEFTPLGGACGGGG